MRALHKTVVAGGVVYPAGTAATDELEALIPDEHWTDGYGHSAPAGASLQEIAELRQLAAQEIATRDARISELEAEVERLNDEIEELTTPLDPGSAPVEVVDYLAKTGKELKDLIDERNADRDPAGETYIRVEPPGNKPELAAALQTDDIRASGS